MQLAMQYSLLSSHFSTINILTDKCNLTNSYTVIISVVNNVGSITIHFGCIYNFVMLPSGITCSSINNLGLCYAITLEIIIFSR